jgi:hypothetical protein
MGINWQAVILLGWFLGVLVLAVLLLQRAWFVRGLIAQSEPAVGKLTDILSDCCHQLGTRKRFELSGAIVLTWVIFNISC